MKPVALVTGGSRGIGKGICKKLCENGYNVAFNGVRPEGQVRETLKELSSTGSDVIYCQGDISSATDRESIMAGIRSHFGRLNVLVNNAGVAPRERKDPLKATEESYERVMRINLKGPYFLTQGVARWMVEQKQEDSSFSATIVNVGSISASVVSPKRGEYCMSKAGLAMHSKIWAVRLAEYDIPVYEVRPGIIKTDMTSAVTDKYDKLIAGGLTAQPRWGYPEDVGKGVLSLVEGDFPYSTGEVMMIDGGLSIQRL
ncbi:NAD(P)-dependent dehydrogenase, short-chain alcohol dehydrogenase family [Fodinibius roseus]|uniref:NAD(P)-dependent dehydrogenase, short-chain alcohol dehydrogenase family n=1 Tax=Fodinibius roseus TaxID=1194090 RepID=A0A1M5GTK5_9BACT|nr:3-ketoacyl-ACP reductase [Fodinibius roseus]SHG07076.1 NAD(P)-dependent dehydrogenase, short-chain alcohol dehydrogenase family [Fodinibius roseus]